MEIKARSTTRGLEWAVTGHSRGHRGAPLAHQVRLPTVSLITTSDRLVRPSKQRELAEALNAHVIEADADHDLPLVKSDEYARLIWTSCGWLVNIYTSRRTGSSYGVK